MKDPNCGYCVKGEAVTWALPICELKTGIVYLFKEQSKYGRCVLAHHEHVGEFIELSDEERNDFFNDLAIVSRAIHKVYHPDKVNYGAYGDTGHHLHFHLVPKYKDKDEWGGVFQMFPDKYYPSEEEYAKMIADLKAAIEEQL
ncbi:HIT family protein [Anaerolentibacter hominis]|uniref:HIT family protein n=1 Tax=Anaerolentibacter hominis TaxID=3079009 RepID=UPI0031B845D2